MTQRARATIRDEVLKRPTVETGGALFGWRTPEGIVVDGAGDPGPRAKHRPRSFQTDRRHTQRLIDQVHAESDGAIKFIGSWHSHPGGGAVPSPRDSATAAEISADGPVGLPEPTILVVGTSGTPATPEELAFAAYVWSCTDRRLIQALVVDIPDDVRAETDEPATISKR